MTAGQPSLDTGALADRLVCESADFSNSADWSARRGSFGRDAEFRARGSNALGDRRGFHDLRQFRADWTHARQRRSGEPEDQRPAATWAAFIRSIALIFAFITTVDRFRGSRPCRILMSSRNERIPAKPRRSICESWRGDRAANIGNDECDQRYERHKTSVDDRNSLRRFCHNGILSAISQLCNVRQFRVEFNYAGSNHGISLTGHTRWQGSFFQTVPCALRAQYQGAATWQSLSFSVRSLNHSPHLESPRKCQSSIEFANSTNS